MPESKYQAGFGMIISGQNPQTFMIPIYSTTVLWYSWADCLRGFDNNVPQLFPVGSICHCLQFATMNKQKRKQSKINVTEPPDNVRFILFKSYLDKWLDSKYVTVISKLDKKKKHVAIKKKSVHQLGLNPLPPQQLNTSQWRSQKARGGICPPITKS